MTMRIPEWDALGALPPQSADERVALASEAAFLRDQLRKLPEKAKLTRSSLEARLRVVTERLERALTKARANTGGPEEQTPGFEGQTPGFRGQTPGFEGPGLRYIGRLRGPGRR